MSPTDYEIKLCVSLTTLITPGDNNLRTVCDQMCPKLKGHVAVIMLVSVNAFAIYIIQMDNVGGG